MERKKRLLALVLTVFAAISLRVAYSTTFGGPVLSGSACGGDTTGTYPNCTVAKLNGAAYTFPNAHGAAATVLTDVAGNGTLSWASGGSNGWVAIHYARAISQAGLSTTTSRCFVDDFINLTTYTFAPAVSYVASTGGGVVIPPAASAQGNAVASIVDTSKIVYVAVKMAYTTTLASGKYCIVGPCDPTGTYCGLLGVHYSYSTTKFIVLTEDNTGNDTPFTSTAAADTAMHDIEFIYTPTGPLIEAAFDDGSWSTATPSHWNTTKFEPITFQAQATVQGNCQLDIVMTCIN